MPVPAGPSAPARAPRQNFGVRSSQATARGLLRMGNHDRGGVARDVEEGLAELERREPAAGSGPGSGAEHRGLQSPCGRGGVVSSTGCGEPRPALCRLCVFIGHKIQDDR